MASLTRRHNAAARNLSRLESARLAERKDTVLPGPPLPGTPEIEPIETVSEILREADTQENCVASKIDAVLGGSYYLYRMHVPERATLALVRDEGGWELAEIAGAGNARVSEAAAYAVRAWLSKATGGMRP